MIAHGQFSSANHFDLITEATEAALDRASALRFVARFAERWLGEPLDGTSGALADHLDTCEADLGVRLPPAVREFHELVGRRHDLFSNQDVLLTTVQRQMYVDDDALILRHENQLACRWGILLEDLDHDDPPVVVLTVLADKAQEQWEPWTDTFSAAVVQWLVYESCLRSGFGDLAVGFDRAEDLAELSARGRPLGIGPFPLGIGPFPAGHLSVHTGARWLLVDDVVVLADGSTILISAQSREAIDGFRRRYPADWLAE